MPPKPVIYGWLSTFILFGAEAINQWRQYDIVFPTPIFPPGTMPVVVSLVLLIAALWVILSKRYTPTDRHWAYGSVGTIVGFWLHT